jgi:hypothetical protein
LENAKNLSDSFVKNLISDAREEAWMKTSDEFRKVVQKTSFDPTLDSMFDIYGKPTECEYKMVEEIKTIDSSHLLILPKRFWYACATTKYEKGNYFLFVEVISNQVISVSRFSIVNFPFGVPPNLK